MNREKNRSAVMHVRITTFGTDRNLDQTVKTAMEALRSAKYRVELVDVDVELDQEDDSKLVTESVDLVIADPPYGVEWRATR